MALNRVRSARGLAPAALIACAALIGGCGGGEKTVTVETPPATETTPPPTETQPTTDTSAYQDEVTQVDQDLGALADDVPSARGFGSARFTRRCYALGDRVDAIVDRLEALDPPPQVRREHEDLIAQVEEVKDFFDELASASEADHREEAIHLLGDISGDLGQIRETLGDILQELNR